MINANKALNSILYGLRLRWGIFVVLCTGSAVLGYLILHQAWTPASALRWLILAAAVLIYQAVVLGSNLEKNHRQAETNLLPSLGIGNHMTLLRGILIAGLVGFLFSPRPSGWLIWIPGILYTLADAADFLDGYLARVTNHATRLGEILDMSFDGLGVLAASLLAVQYGQVPVWYLAVALARYLFLAGMWVRKITGRTNYELPPSISRRLFAGLQMGFIGVILWPVFSPPGTYFAASLFALPFLIGFGRDWLFVSGILEPDNQGRRKNPLSKWGPPALRLVAAGLASYIFTRRLDSATPGEFPILFMILELAVAALILFGVTGRIVAVAGLILIGLSQQFASLNAPQFILAAVYTILLFAGTGALSIWAPEDKAVYGRPGEVPQPGIMERGQ
jgi:CDP-diacylglycerol---glycerol-3-phosphate 3-phosphatidyltransferase